MRVHVIARDTSSNHILPRLARTFITQDWTLSDGPDPSADINYFFPYLEWERFQAFCDTPTAAWFTHRETSEPNKAQLWNDAACSVSLRLTSSRLYLDGLLEHGAAALVTPYLDTDKFSPKSGPSIFGDTVGPTDRPPVVGTSGYVYKTGRKGEHLLKRLADSEFGRTLSLVACGSGWPIHAVNLPWENVQAFYHKLHVYLCTSLVEGPGYGPLEALACAVPVVVPRGVGIFDELPDVQNLFRYKAGDYEDMVGALQDALAEPYNGESLRGITTRFTQKAWIEDHSRAFENLLYNAEPVGALPPWAGRSGIYYVAYGDEARDCVKRAIISAKKHMPDTPVCLVSDAPVNAGEDVFVAHSDDDIGARGVKTQIYDLSPAEWEYVLYLDADTEIVADISFLFQLLEDGWELAFCINPAKYVLAREMKRANNVPECNETFAIMGSDEHVQFNGGVFAFRRTKQIARMLRTWHKEWQRYGGRDQAALDRALFQYPVRLYTLGNEWNTITRYLDASATAGILHYPMQARRYGKVPQRLDSPEAWAHVADRKRKQ